MTRKHKWFKAPNSAGDWYYWILGSAVVRRQVVIRGNGMIWPQLKGKLITMNTERPTTADMTARLWCRATSRPKLPPLKLRKELERRFVKRDKRLVRIEP